ncbi:ArsC/Spx/MgsR family protein [Sulfuricurvum sp.]|uniref:ArsC/Spx/MgsR family protein n=1 Tax=Sulfuricurvum sp. TaxID=2025608 RepID=UPI00261CB084|nr:ArsC/Spx/MgsR family protein [Sulfuricurvum sp.]MDD2267310.1 arsenate reductase family protein [Sulfuricurvum sp.]MDD2783932.1 arsenate reductase family protein [Sulfuricurvum sp.]
MVKLVVFYEKPFCAANAKQKQILRSSGCILIERNLLEHGLSSDELRTFMGEKRVPEWFNPAAPSIKNGKINPDVLDETEALELLMKDPILIRRPLMVIGIEKLCGFDEKRVSEILDRYVEAMPKINCMEKGCLEKKSAG